MERRDSSFGQRVVVDGNGIFIVIIFCGILVVVVVVVVAVVVVGYISVSFTIYSCYYTPPLSFLACL